MMELLRETGTAFTSSAEREIVRDLKEKLCYVALDYEKELKEYENDNSKCEVFELPDGSSIKVGS